MFLEGDEMKIKFRLPHVITAAIVAAMALSIPASALTVDTTLYGNVGGDVGNVDVHAVVTRTGNIYDYNYTISYYAVGGKSAAIHSFSISNDGGTSYFGAANNAGFSNSVYSESNALAAIEWLGNGNAITVGQTKTFSYQSEYMPMDLLVYTCAADGGGYADGETVGMGAMIPEPSSILALALGLSGFAPFVIRRKKQ